jgi:hypothetical protein
MNLKKIFEAIGISKMFRNFCNFSGIFRSFQRKIPLNSSHSVQDHRKVKKKLTLRKNQEHKPVRIS